MHRTSPTTDSLPRVGLVLPPVGGTFDPSAITRMAAAAERMGVHSLWAGDRVLGPVGPGAHHVAALDPMVALTLVATATRRVRLGTSVMVAPWYSPVLLARSAATLDRISGGRLTLGLGLGRAADEFAAVGVAPTGRQARLEQMLEVMARVWCDDVVEIETTRECVMPSSIALEAVQRPRVPLLLASPTAAGLERVARRADGWITTGLGADEIRERWTFIGSIATSYGRRADTLRLVVHADVRLTASDAGRDRAPFTGSLRQVRGDVARVRELGANEVVLDLASSIPVVTALAHERQVLQLAADVAGDLLDQPAVAGQQAA